MKLFLIAIGIIILCSAFYMARKDKHRSCINKTTYNLIQNTPSIDEYCKYLIIREENQLVFKTKKNYTVFIIKRTPQETGIDYQLIGLDGYGMRDKAFHQYICQLIKDYKG